LLEKTLLCGRKNLEY